MGIEESLWISNQIDKYEDDFFPLLNLGSSTKSFRENVQPWINEIIFNPLQYKNKIVVHSDIKKDEGVDVAGDVLDEEFAKQLKHRNFKCIICSNVLEHIKNVDIFCEAIESIALSGTYIIITVPFLYPYHKDPIDTKFRPNINDILKLFPQCKLVDGIVHTSNKTHFFTLIKEPYTFFITIKNWLIPRFGIKEWKMRCSDIPDLFKKYKYTCVLLRKM